MYSINDIYKISKKYYNFIDNNNLYNSLNIDYLNNNSTYINDFKDIMINNNFINNKFLNYFNNIKYVFKINSDLHNNISFYIYNDKKLNQFQITKLIKIYKRIIILKLIYNINNFIDFHISFAPFSRFIPNNNDYFTPININGGFTFSNNNQIYVYRNDEYGKVIIHEFLHKINIINNSLDNLSNNDINILKKTLNISNNSTFNPVESVIEFWATIYNLIFISIEFSIPINSLINKEISFSFNQYFKIIKYHNFYNKLWYEKTNVFSYIILKLIILINFKEFLKFKLPYSHKFFIDFIINNFNKFKKIKYNNINNFNFTKNKSLDFMLFSSF